MEVVVASNLALKRAKRDLRRRQVVAQKRRLELVESGPGAQARRAALTPIRHCLVQGDLEQSGIASVILARGHASAPLTTAVFLVDVYCLGIKDVFVHELETESVALLLEAMRAAAPLTPAQPAHARKLLRDAAAWAASIGFTPHRDFAAIENIFGDVNPDDCDARFSFGLDGKPYYVPGPSETRAQVRQRLAHLATRLGEDGFDYAIAI